MCRSLRLQMKCAQVAAPGFTLVELITVILLLGILSAVAVARSGRTSDFEPRRFASSAAEQYRFAHGLSSGRFGDPISFSVNATADGSWRFTTSSSIDGEVRREDLAAGDISLTITNGATSIGVATGDSLQIDFSPTGDVLGANLGATTLQPDLGIRLIITGDSAHSLCIYPTGYIGVGSCV